MSRMCKYCTFCRCTGRAGAQGAKVFGRKHYYCENPNTEGDKNRNKFVGYGDNTRESPLQLKTHPKWCPLEKEPEKAEKVKQEDTRKRYKAKCPECGETIYICKSLGMEMGFMDTGSGECCKCKKRIKITFNFVKQELSTERWENV